jgi:hypothetical protein
MRFSPAKIRMALSGKLRFTCETSSIRISFKFLDKTSTKFLYPMG